MAILASVLADCAGPRNNNSDDNDNTNTNNNDSSHTNNSSNINNVINHTGTKRVTNIDDDNNDNDTNHNGKSPSAAQELLQEALLLRAPAAGPIILHYITLMVW